MDANPRHGTEVRRLPEAMRRWPGSQEINNTAHNYIYNDDLSFFEILSMEPGRAKAFMDSMTYFTSNPMFNPKYILEYDWSRHTNETVVDIRGSQGQVALEIAKKHPDIRIIVEDRPEIIELAPKDAPSNVSFLEHDFFRPKPVQGTDVYLLRWIIHDWPEKFAIKILQALKPVLKAGTRIIVMNAIIPEKGVLTPYQERPSRDFEIIMKLAFNARERYESEWKQLVTDALGEDNFRHPEIIRPVGSQLKLLVIE
ncbi:S-adenosyl-L-methionine-dependent methyltransferase [Curvularia clavata]|uniref:S-adenosyl-L-methionine-dependent methyltransferase n=1 Tax=Curvularia clavata TaxID=95742 RepID=A0A9Q8ZHD4_CURCL|nr:S-adenosyl-L-methionine-dependent methyltransferase [Curvularia clavata]